VKNASYEMWRRENLIRNDVSQDRFASVFRVEEIRELRKVSGVS
jgi:hypothetical protein